MLLFGLACTRPASMTNRRTENTNRRVAMSAPTEFCHYRPSALKVISASSLSRKASRFMKSRQFLKSLRYVEFHSAQSLNQSYKEHSLFLLYYTMYKISRYKCLQQFYMLFYTQLIDTDDDDAVGIELCCSKGKVIPLQARCGPEGG